MTKRHRLLRLDRHGHSNEHLVSVWGIIIKEGRRKADILNPVQHALCCDLHNTAGSRECIEVARTGWRRGSRPRRRQRRPGPVRAGKSINGPLPGQVLAYPPRIQTARPGNAPRSLPERRRPKSPITPCFDAVTSRRFGEVGRATTCGSRAKGLSRAFPRT